MCSKGFPNIKQKTVQCSQYPNHSHLKCTALVKYTYQRFSGRKDFLCQYCSHNSYIELTHNTYEKHVHDKQYGIFCDGCNLLTH